MIHTYLISGMTCNGCAATVKRTLSAINHIEQVDIDLPANEAVIVMDKHVATAQLQQALQEAGKGKYSIQEKGNSHQQIVSKTDSDEVTRIAVYKPLILVFAYIIGFTFLAEWIADSFVWMRWMEHFMGAFFITFSFFKMLNLQGFADSYSSYDIIARRWRGWGFIYAFIELFLGIAYFLSFKPLLTNTITLVVMVISIVGVLQTVLANRKIKCACLGTVFNLPMSTVTIVEDGLMILISGLMLAFYL